MLSPDLQKELNEVVLPLTSDTPSESELRLAQAQLVGWLEGLFHGIQATLFTQQAMAQSQLEEVRRRRALEMAQPGGPTRTAERLPLDPDARGNSDDDRTALPARVGARQLARAPGGATARLARSRRARGRARASIRALPPLVFAGEARSLTESARRRGRGPGVPARRRRLRRVVRGVLGRRQSATSSRSSCRCRSCSPTGAVCRRSRSAGWPGSSRSRGRRRWRHATGSSCRRSAATP